MTYLCSICILLNRVMRRSIITLLILLPLAMLTSLSCPTKQNVKQLLGIPVNTSLQLERGSSTVCTAISAQTVKRETGETKQQHLNTQYIPGGLLLHSFVPTDIILNQGSGTDPVVFSAIPIFLAYRKLII